MLVPFIKNCYFCKVIELERHIEILLLSNDCVIVPDFGGFMAHHADAYYDEEEHLFLPPRRTLGFNRQLTINDSLLVQSYIEAYDISYPEALRRIEDEVRELKQHIANDGEYVFNDLGTIRLNDEGRYEFEPCEAGILTPGLYGLSSYEMMPLHQVVKMSVKDVDPAALQEPEEKSEAAAYNVVSINAATPMPLDDEAETPGVIHPNMVRSLVAACLAALAMLVFPADMVNNGGNKVQKSTIDTNAITRIVPREKSEKPVAAKKLAVKRDTAKVVAAARKDSVDVPTPPYYTVVLCSRVSRKNAANFAKELNRQGYTEARVLERGANSKVIYGHYSTERQAYNVLNHLANRANFEGCWVLKVRG